ncbi:cuticle protein CP575-like [Oratosquilla oratoria]|uniref:cuticle protein CP575-like n=1 Tax=Oratosquilla oratoria TaxID=337810 RepID=UPI003F77456F
MKILVVLSLCLVGASLALPSDIIDFELDNHEHEQEGQAGRAVEGEYSWVAPNGEEYVVKYVADHLGYRVVDSNVVPQARAADFGSEAEEDDDDDDK